jgi:hypothetical protein
MSDAGLASPLHAVMRDIADAARRAGRDPQSVKLIAVTKTVPEHAIEEAMGWVSAASARTGCRKQRSPAEGRHRRLRSSARCSQQGA